MVFGKGILNAAKQLEDTGDEDFASLQTLLDGGKQSRREKWKYKRMNWQAELVKNSDCVLKRTNG